MFTCWMALFKCLSDQHDSYFREQTVSPKMRSALMSFYHNKNTIVNKCDSWSLFTVQCFRFVFHNYYFCSLHMRAFGKQLRQAKSQSIMRPRRIRLPLTYLSFYYFSRMHIDKCASKVCSSSQGALLGWNLEPWGTVHVFFLYLVTKYV